ncbi:MAG TPA: polyprenyl synthetase family protein [Herpetosiphonaceae bacterium]
MSDLAELCCLATGGDRRRTERFALAWKILYTALYMLDSVEDGDVRDAPWAQWGAGPAINISTGLLASAGAMLSNLEQTGVGADTAQAVRLDFFQTLLDLTAGQHADLTLQQPTLEQRWRIAQAKSGALFGLACRSGARLANAERGVVDQLSEFGQTLGVLIQIGDDIDGLWAKHGQASDLLAGDRWTLPVAYAMSVLPAAERERLHRLLRATGTDSGAEAEARSQIVAAGAILYLTTEARRLHRQAHAALLQAVPRSAASDGLLRLLDAYTPLKDL